jgi:LacI family transcriptional regulator
MAATIKEIASMAGVSPSTASIVLNGKSAERKISKITQDKVFEAARKLNYQPNVSARRLRSQSNESLIIAVFWASDFRAPMMVRFLRGLQEAALTCEKKCEIMIHPYENDKLHFLTQAFRTCHAAIICNASEDDMRFLENNSFPVPIVLYNRSSQKFCTVNVNDSLLGEIPARIFSKRHHKIAAVLDSEAVFPGMKVRTESFISEAKKLGLSVCELFHENSMKGGYRGGEEICRMNPLPDCLFCTSDFLAIGALRALLQRKIYVPDQMEIISIGNGDCELEEYAYVSLSVVHLPMEKMAAACLRLALDLLSGRVSPPCSIELPVVYQERESCGNI